MMALKMFIGVVFFAVFLPQGNSYTFVYRSKWYANPAKKLTRMAGHPTTLLVKEVAYTNRWCENECPVLQKRDMETYHHDDIDCNFVFDNYPSICEGRGWSNSVMGNKVLVLCMMENSRLGLPVTSNIWKSFSAFLETEDFKTYMDPNYKIITLRDMYPMSLNPGSGLYDKLKQLPHYKKVSAMPELKGLWKKEDSSYYIG